MSACVQVHADELRSLLKVTHSGSVITSNGLSSSLDTEAKEDILWAIWRLLGANAMTRVVFGDGDGFGLLLSVLESVVPEYESLNLELSPDSRPTGPSLTGRMEVLDALLHVITVGAAENPTNRNKLHECISTQSFKGLLQVSGLISVKFEQKLAELLFDVALERVHSPSQNSEGLPALLQAGGDTSIGIGGSERGFVLDPHQVTQGAVKEEVYNAGAIEVLLYFLLQFSVKLQLQILIWIERLVYCTPRNQDALTSAGKPFLEVLEFLHVSFIHKVGALVDLLLPLCHPLYWRYYATATV